MVHSATFDVVPFHPNTHVVLLYVTPLPAERFASDIFVHWSFWNAERTESVAVTVPDDAENPVRSDVRLSFPENAL